MGLSGAEAYQELSAAGTTTEGYMAASYGYRLAKQSIPAGEPVNQSYPLLDALYRVLYEGAPAAEALWEAVRGDHDSGRIAK
jgi:glycerol-3-phosphate dehydrogenase